MALVSVNIPCFNSAKFIGETLKSVLNQTYTDFEIIVMDDGSTDGTGRIVNSLRDSRIKYFYKANEGLSETRNKGILASAGKYIAFLDHDDIWLPQKLEKEMAILETGDAGLVFSDCYISRGGIREKMTYFDRCKPKRGLVFEDLLFDSSNFIPLSTVVMRSDIFKDIGYFKKEFKIGEEYELFLRAAHKYKFDYVDEPLAEYRIHENNFSARKELFIKEAFDILEFWKKACPELLDRNKERFLKKEAALLGEMANFYAMNSQKKKAMENFNISLERFGNRNVLAKKYILSALGCAGYKCVKKINRYFHDEESRFFAGRHEGRISGESEFYKDFFLQYFKNGGLSRRILDIGSGTGLVGKVQPEGRCSLVCTDISYDMLNVARENLKTRCKEYVVCDAERLPFASASFDVITCNAAMHHFPSIDDFARELYRVLAPGGTAIVGFEANRKFWTTKPVSILYRVLAKFTHRRGAGAANYGLICKRVNERLLAEKAIDRPMKDTDILTLVDIHSPNAGKQIDYSKGFDVLELVNGVFKDYKAKVYYHYDEDHKLFGLFNRLLFPRAAPQFSLVLEKSPKRKTKILFLFVHLNYGGAEVGLLTTLKNIDRNRFDCVIVSIEKKGVIGDEIEKLGFKVIYLNTEARLFNIGLIGRMRNVLKEERPDILHTSLFYANFFGRIAALFNKPAVIVTEERSTYTEKRFYHVAIDKVLSAVTDKIIVCSNSVLDFTAKQEKINRNKFHLIYNAVDAGRFDVNQSKDAVRSEYGFSGAEFIIGTVGSVIPKKGHRFLIEAFSGLTNDIPQAKLLIIGDGPERAGLEALAANRSVGDRVLFMGARSDVPRLMKAMDIFVLPSLQEGFPRTLLEAMYSRLPVIASNISGIPETVDDGENGFLAGPGDAGALKDKILRLYKDKDLSKVFGEKARRKIESGYMPKNYTDNLESLYSELLQEKA